MMILNGIMVGGKRAMKYRDDDDIGYILEVDFDYLKEVHDLHGDSPSASQIMYINEKCAFTSPEDYFGKDAGDDKENKLVLTAMHYCNP